MIRRAPFHPAGALSARGGFRPSRPVSSQPE